MDTNEQIDIIFNGTKEILNVVNRGDPLIAPLLAPNATLCHLIGTEIKLIKQVGQGQYGTVFEITVPGKGTKKYAVKRGNIKTTTADLSKLGPFEKGTNYDMTDTAPLDVLKAFNPKLDFGNVKHLKNVIIPTFNVDITECLTRYWEYAEPIPFKAGGVRAPPGSYLCDNDSYSEYYIGSLLGESYRKEECINFFDFYSMFTCENPGYSNITSNAKIPPYYQYIFMDKIDFTLGEAMQCLPSNAYTSIVNELGGDDAKETIQNGIFIQTVFAIAFYQTKYEISHNDLHRGNVFVECVKPTNTQDGTIGTTFNGKLLSDMEFYHYKIDDVDLYFPAIPIIVKIGDFGLSIKYSTPIVGSKYVFKSGLPTLKLQPTAPNHFIPQYDLFFNTVNCLSLSKSKQTTKLIASSMKFLVPEGKNVDGENIRSILHGLRTSKMITKSGRVNLEKLKSLKTAHDLLKSNVFQKYRTKPNSGKIVTLGVI